MAAYDLVTWSTTNKRNVRQVSTSITLDLLAIKIGATGLTIAEATGHFDFGNKRITNLATPTASDHAATKGYVDLVTTPIITTWLPAVLDGPTNTPPGSPTTGDRYLIGTSPTGAWSADANKVAQYNGTGWDFTTPTNGTFLDVLTFTTGLYFYNAGSWSTKLFEGTTASAGLELVGADVRVKFEVSNPTLETSSGALKVKLDAAGAVVTGAGGLKTNLESSNPTLQISSNQLGAKLDAAGAIVTGSGGLKANLESSNPTLQIATNQLGVKLDAAGAIITGASGIKAQVDSGAKGTLKISSNTVTSDFATTLTNDNAGTISAAQAVYIKANGNVDLAQANVANLDKFALGIVEAATIATTASGKIIVRRGALVAGFTGLTPGQLVYIDRSTAGALTQSLTGFVTGEMVYSIGRAFSATEIIFDPQFVLEY